MKEVREAIEKAKKITVLTGAGISTDSGIPDFRSRGGKYSDQKVIEIVSHAYFRKQPRVFWPQFKDIFGMDKLDTYKPNSGHEWIASLEKDDRIVQVITQNVDGLHGLSGSTNVTEMHGSLRGAICLGCSNRYGFDHIMAEEVPMCSCGAVLKPDVVLFDEQVYGFHQAMSAVINTDVLICMGTSLEVHPFNGLPSHAKYSGRSIPMVIVNRDETAKDYLFNHKFQGSISDFIKLMN